MGWSSKCIVIPYVQNEPTLPLSWRVVWSIHDESFDDPLTSAHMRSWTMSSSTNPMKITNSSHTKISVIEVSWKMINNPKNLSMGGAKSQKDNLDVQVDSWKKIRLDNELQVVPNAFWLFLLFLKMLGTRKMQKKILYWVLVFKKKTPDLLNHFVEAPNPENP